MVRVLVVGDLGLDCYVTGTAGRISPEAPVPVLCPSAREERPGMVGNVALNLRSLGVEVTLLSRIGPDQMALKQLLTNEGINTDHLVIEEGYRAPVKTRMIAAGHQLLRIDEEITAPTKAHIDLPLDGIDLIAVSDYKKGFVTDELLQRLIATGLPVIVDPKGKNYSRYRGATLIKPNLKEAKEAAHHEGPLEEIANTLLQTTEAKALLITRSEHGISLFTPSSREDFPVDVHEVRDVTGAGDTVLAVLSAAIANGSSFHEAAKLANYAASLAVQHFGCARITLDELGISAFQMN